MLTRFLEFLIVQLVNAVRGGLEAPRRHEPATALPEGHVLLGHEIPSPDAPGPAGRSGKAVTLAPGARKKHLYAIGSTGSGKTNLLLGLIESDIAERHSFCVIDLRGDLVDRILPRLAAAETPESLGDRLLVMDLRDSQSIVPFNPLSGPGEAHHRALHLLSVLKQHADSWGIQLEETLRNCLLALAETRWSLLEIEPFLCHPGFRTSVLSRVSDNAVRSFFGRYDQLSEEKQVSWRLPVLNKVTPLLTIPKLRLMFGGRDSSFTFQRLLDDRPGAVLLISLAVDRLHGASHLVGGLLVSAFQSAIMARVDQPEAERVPVHLYVDEFETMATHRFEMMVAEGRRFGLGLCLSHQNLSQVPIGLRHVLRNNVQTQFFFQTGAIDAAELVREIVTPEPRESIRATLLTQGVGEAYLVRRGEPPTRVRLSHCPDPTVDPAAVFALREAALSAYARSQADLEREIEERERSYDDPGFPRAPSCPTYEVRHAKDTRFRPGNP